MSDVRAAKRRQDWPERLFDFVASRRLSPFKWGGHDCCLFACDAILAMTDVDPAGDLRGYTTAKQAVAILAENGGVEGLVEIRCAALGFAELASPRKAQRGDVLMFDNAGEPAVGVCIGDRVAFPGKSGLVFHPVKACRRAWRVG